MTSCGWLIRFCWNLNDCVGGVLGLNWLELLDDFVTNTNHRWSPSPTINAFHREIIFNRMCRTRKFFALHRLMRFTSRRRRANDEYLHFDITHMLSSRYTTLNVIYDWCLTEWDSLSFYLSFALRILCRVKIVSKIQWLRGVTSPFIFGCEHMLSAKLFQSRKFYANS